MCPFQNAERAFPVTDLRFSEQARLYTPATLWFQVKKPVCASQPCLLCQMTTNFTKKLLLERTRHKQAALPAYLNHGGRPAPCRRRPPKASRPQRCLDRSLSHPLLLAVSSVEIEPSFLIAATDQFARSVEFVHVQPR